MRKKVVAPKPITGEDSTGDLLREKFPAFVGRNLRETYRLMRKSVDDGYTIFFTFSGALTPAGLHHSCILPLVELGAISAITTTGANLYHDIHRSVGHVIREINPHSSDLSYRKEQTVRIYDLGLTTEVLADTDRFVGKAVRLERFQRPMTTPEFHHELGGVLADFEEEHGVQPPSLLATCYRHDIPIFCGAPQDGSILMEALQAKLLEPDSFRFSLDIHRDILQMAALQLVVQKEGPTAIWILGGGVPKNYTLQGEPVLSQVFGMEARGFDLDVQICVDVPDNGALSSCSAGEGHTWGKTSAECVESSSAYVRSDATVAFPFLVHALIGETLSPRPQRRLFRTLPQAEELLRKEFQRIFQGPNPPLYQGY